MFNSLETKDRALFVHVSDSDHWVMLSILDPFFLEKRHENKVHLRWHFTWGLGLDCSCTYLIVITELCWVFWIPFLWKNDKKLIHLRWPFIWGLGLNFSSTNDHWAILSILDNLETRSQTLYINLFSNITYYVSVFSLQIWVGGAVQEGGKLAKGRVTSALEKKGKGNKKLFECQSTWFLTD